MKLRILLAAVALLAEGATRQATAQTPADSASLVRATASVVIEQVIPYLGGREPNFMVPPATGFDSAVAAIVLRAPGMESRPRPLRANAQWVGTHGFTVRGDTAAVLVEVGTSVPPNGGIDTYIEKNLYLFVPEGPGWRFVRRQFVSGADSGAIRG